MVPFRTIFCGSLVGLNIRVGRHNTRALGSSIVELDVGKIGDRDSLKVIILEFKAIFGVKKMVFNAKYYPDLYPYLASKKAAAISARHHKHDILVHMLS